MTSESPRDARVAIVTGATRGIGRAVTELLLESGASVVGVGRSPDSRDALAQDLSGFGDALVPVAQDMRDADAGERITAQAIERWGRLDLVVNNASSFEYRPAGDPSREEWLDLITLKLLGYLSVMTAAIPHMTASGGVITNVAGTAGVAATPDSPHVGAVNAAVISMSESFAAKVASSGIRVNVVTPGAVDTDRFKNRVERYAADHERDESEVRAQFSGNIPVGFPADPRAVATMILMMSDERLGSLTGAHVIFDGGATMSGRRRL
jgi:NAD(P)-dependent dehydrogenase (short-subunit alcohol dehydrogenase family)